MDNTNDSQYAPLRLQLTPLENWHLAGALLVAETSVGPSLVRWLLDFSAPRFGKILRSSKIFEAPRCGSIELCGCFRAAAAADSLQLPFLLTHCLLCWGVQLFRCAQ